MRRLTTIIAFAAMLCMCQMGFAQQWEISGVKYEVLNGNNYATVTGHTFDTEKTNVVFLQDELKDDKGNVYKVEAIDVNVFQKAQNLQFVYGGKYIKEVRKNAFDESGLLVADFPNVETLGDAAFQHCYSLVRVNLPKVTVAPQFTFTGCKKLSEVNMPKLKTIGNKAFQGSGIVHADFPELETIGEAGLYDCDNMISFRAPKLNSIADNGIDRCDELKIVEFGASLRKMGANALYYCSAIQSLTFLSPVPPEIGADALKWDGKNHNIYVPAESLDAYKAALQVSGTTIRPIADYTLTVTTSDNALGKCVGAGTYASGTEVQISAIANDGGIFRQWSDGRTDNPRTMTLYGDSTLTAQFDEATQLPLPTKSGMNMVVNLANGSQLEIPTSEVVQVYIMGEGITEAPFMGTLAPEADALRLDFVGDHQPIEREHRLVDTRLEYLEGIDQIHFLTKEGYVPYDLTLLRGFSFIQGTPGVQLSGIENPKEPGAYYTSFFSSLEEYALPEGMTAYMAAKDDKGVVTLQELDTPVIPMYEAVVLRSNKPELKLTISDTGASRHGDNFFVGRDVAAPAASDHYYKLCMVDGELGFQKMGWDEYVLPNTAFIMGTGVTDIVMGGNPTDIDHLTPADAPASVYDLSGRQLSGMQKGMNIVRMHDGSVRKVAIDK